MLDGPLAAMQQLRGIPQSKESKSAEFHGSADNFHTCLEHERQSCFHCSLVQFLKATNSVKFSFDVITTLLSFFDFKLLYILGKTF